MAYYGGVWKTDRVLIELQRQDDILVLTRTRGKKGKQKQRLRPIFRLSPGYCQGRRGTAGRASY